jgi:Zn-dependent M28 family amino/carboxypeptidase
MYSHRLMLIPFAALAAACAPVTVPQPAARAAPPAISAATLDEVSRTLASDAFEGRAPFTAGEEKTVAYIADRFAKAGLRPGNKGDWYQQVPLVEITAKPGLALNVTGGATPLSFAYKTDMVLGTKQVRPRVELRQSEMVFVGYGINAPELGWNDYAGIDVKGKTVVILINDPDWQTKTLDGPFGGRAMTYYGRWTYKYEEAARQGAAAAIIVHDTEPAAYPFSVVRSSWTGPQLHKDTPDGGASESQAIGWLTNEAARRMFVSAGKDFDQLSAGAKVKGFRAVPLGLKASATIENDIRRQTSRNVIGIIPGTKRPNEYIVYSAHWDHLGRCEPAPDGDDICNGWIDNATGVAGLVALAEAYRSQGSPERSVIFLAVTAEESGLLGSEHYGADPVYPLKDTVAGLNMDALLSPGPARDVVVVGPGKSQLEDYLKRAVVPEGRVVVPEPTPERGYYYRSDHFSLAKRGVPMLYFESGPDLLNGGVAAGSKVEEEYRDKRYHGPKDEYVPGFDWSGVAADLRLFYTIGRELADGDDWPNWYPTAEFRAARDQSRGNR